MAFLRNTWYAVLWSSDLQQSMLARTVLNQPLVLYRKSDDTIAALENRCAHRFVPLHLGKLKDDVVECAYHGLRYDATGACVFNPHGSGKISPNMCVKSYKTCERFGAVWVWMGDSALADPSSIVDFGQFADPEHYTCVRGTLHVDANYQLISDNLLDLTHSQYVHPLFSNPEGPSTMEPDTEQDPDTVWAKFGRPNQYPNQYFQMLGFPKDVRGNHRAHMRWNAPGTLLLDVGMTRLGEAAEDGISIPTAHLLTPETETTTHYLWAMARNFRLDDQDLSDTLLRMGTQVFKNEDQPIIESQQRGMGSATDLMSLGPALLETDRAPVRARRLLNRKLKEQAEAQLATSRR